MNLRDETKDLAINLGLWTSLVAIFVLFHVFVYGISGLFFIEGILIFGCMYVWSNKDEIKNWRRQP